MGALQRIQSHVAIAAVLASKACFKSSTSYTHRIRSCLHWWTLALHNSHSIACVRTMAADLSTLTELIVVCGHATFIGSHRDIMSESQWLLQPYQRSNPATGKLGEHETFVSHILSATFSVAARPEALLVFSGGRTSQASRTEAQGYEQVHLGLDDAFAIGDRYAREDYATDSFQNLLFSILRFKQLVGRYPHDITVVTHAFKRDRILGRHAAALRWPADRIRLQGLDPPFTMDEWVETIESERKAESAFARNPFGAQPPLSDKRLARNFDPDVVEHFYQDLEPEALAVLRYVNRSDQDLPLPERFPWEAEEAD